MTKQKQSIKNRLTCTISILFLSIAFAFSNNRIESDSQYLSPVISALDSLLCQNDTVINIVHLGDSHVQAGFFTGVIRKSLQSTFGNAGRGFIAPLRITKTNEPTDYFFYSSNKDWISGKVIQNRQRTDIGPAGMAIATYKDSVDFTLGVTPRNGASYRFSKMIFYRDTLSCGICVTEDSLSVTTGFHPRSAMNTDTIKFNSPTDTIRFTISEKIAKQDSVTMYGASLLNDSCGIVYHSMGINGAEYKDYTSESFINKLSVLNPALIIVSLGTNESFRSNYNETRFASELDLFITMLKEGYPEVKIILTTPPECYSRVVRNGKRIFIQNPNTESVSRVITNKAKEHNIAYWDLFTIYGGKGSSKRWFNEGWLSKDRIHFTARGYARQASMFFEAFMKQFETIIDTSAEQ